MGLIWKLTYFSNLKVSCVQELKVLLNHQILQDIQLRASKTISNLGIINWNPLSKSTSPMRHKKMCKGVVNEMMLSWSWKEALEGIWKKGFLKDFFRPGALNTQRENKTWEGLYTPAQRTPESDSSRKEGSKAMGFLTAGDQETECHVVRDRRTEVVRETGEKIISEKYICTICNQERWWRGSCDEEDHNSQGNDRKEGKNMWKVWGLQMKVITIILLIVTLGRTINNTKK